MQQTTVQQERSVSQWRLIDARRGWSRLVTCWRRWCPRSTARTPTRACRFPGSRAERSRTRSTPRPPATTSDPPHRSTPSDRRSRTVCAQSRQTHIGGFNQRQVEALPPQINLTLKFVVWAKLQNDDVLLQWRLYCSNAQNWVSLFSGKLSKLLPPNVRF